MVGFGRSSSKKLVSEFSARCFTDIDELPIYNWNRILETGNLSFLQRDERIYLHKPEPGSQELQLLRDVWRSVYAQYIDRFGFSEQYQVILRVRAKIAKMRCKKIITGDAGLYDTLIKVEEFKLGELMKDSVGTEFGEVVLVIKRFVGYDMNLRTTSVAEFYNAVRMMRKMSEATKKAHGRK